ncbi:MAG: hypothetical protein JXR40_11925, partial [Pontiellaceae bacterium]|nr:hypothetical protein [Pontiellaceae bacterium]
STFKSGITISEGTADLDSWSTFDGPITISGGDASLYGGTFKNEITISGGTADLDSWSTFDGPITISGGDASLYGGTFKNEITISGGTADLDSWGTFDGPITISGGTATLDGGTFNNLVTVSGGVATLNSGGTFNHSVNVSGGVATLNGGNYNSSLTVSGGSATLNEGNYSGLITIAGGLLEADGVDLNIANGIEAWGEGEIILVDLEKLSGEISLYEDSSFRIYNAVDDINISLNLYDNARAYLEGEYWFKDGTNVSGQIFSLPGSGVLSDNNGRTIRYEILGNAAIYVGQIPEPAAVTFICMAGLAFLIVRRLFGRSTEPVTAEGAVWPPAGDQLKFFDSDDFVQSNSAEWSRVEWNRRENRWMLRITNQIAMPCLLYPNVVSIERVEPPQVQEELVSVVDPTLIALPDRPGVRSVRFYTETFLRQAAKNRHRR